jgi:Transposase DDE domain group 1
VKQGSRWYPRVRVDTSRSGAVGAAGGVLLTETVAAAGLDAALSAALASWRKPLAVHDPGKVVLDLALALALGGDCLADIAVLRAEPGIYGRVASDPTVSRTLDALAAAAPAALRAINHARAAVRARVWRLAGAHAADHDATVAAPLVIDVDATLVTAHSEKESAAPTFKRGFGHHPLWAFLDHGAQGTGEPLAFLLRKGNAGSNTVADHLTVIRAALAQLPGGRRRGKNVLVRVDGAGGTHELIAWLTRRRLAYSVGFSLPGDLASIQAKLAAVPPQAWAPAYDADGGIRPGAWWPS